MDCEVCGENKAEVRASIQGAILNVCKACASAGKIQAELRSAGHSRIEKISPIMRAAPEAEEFVIPEFPSLISLARQQLGLTQEGLAKRLNEKLSVVQAAEQGKRCDLNLARKFEKFLKVKLVETA